MSMGVGQDLPAGHPPALPAVPSAPAPAEHTLALFGEITQDNYYTIKSQ